MAPSSSNKTSSSGRKKREISDEEKSPEPAKRIKTEPNADTDADSVPDEELDTACINTLVKKDLSSGEEKTVRRALKTLAKLCSRKKVEANAPKNAESVVQIGGHLALIQAIERYKGSEKIQKYAMWALANVACYSDNHICEGIVAIDGIELAVAAMKKFPGSYGLQAYACYLLGNLSYDSAPIAKQVAESPDAVDLVVKAMKAFPASSMVQRGGCVALRSICRHKDKEVIRQVIEAGGRGAVTTATEKHPDDDEIQREARLATMYLWGLRE